MKNTQNIKKIIADTGFDIAGSLMIAIGIYCFCEQADIAPGGLSGLSIMLKYLFGLPVGLLTLIMNIPLLITAYKHMGKEFTVRTLRSVFISTFILDNIVTPFFPQYAGDRLLGSIFGGICNGTGLGLIFMRGSSTAGTDVISYMIERKHPHIPIGRALLLIDCIVLLISILVFGNVESGLFGFVALFCQSKVIDGIVYGLNRSKSVTIISRKNDKIAQRIIGELRRGATLLHGAGAFSGDSRQVILCIVRANEFYRLKHIIATEDPSAFVIVADASEIHGEGFD